MKTWAHIGAVLSFTCFFIAGAWIFLLTARNTGIEDPIPVCIGLCLMGTAFYLGPKLWLAADARTGSAPATESGMLESRFLRYAGIGIAVLVITMIGIAKLRMNSQAGESATVARPE